MGIRKTSEPVGLVVTTVSEVKEFQVVVSLESVREAKADGAPAKAVLKVSGQYHTLFVGDNLTISAELP